MKKPFELPGVTQPEPTAAENEANRALFLREAFFLYSKRRQILANNRLFMVPVPIQSGLAYTGAFPLPVLGAYIEWWMNNEKAQVMDDKGELRGLVYYLSGSPLSGCNSCGLVHPDGTTDSYQAPRFSELWRDFHAIVRRCHALKDRFEAYSLQEAIELLKDPNDVRHRLIRVDADQVF